MPISSGITGQRSWACAGSETITAVTANVVFSIEAYRMRAPSGITDVTQDTNKRASTKAGSLMLVRPVALDDFGGTLVEQLEANSTAEFAGPVCRAAPRRLDEVPSGLVQHRSGQRHLAAINRRVAGDRRVAMAVQHPQHLTLGLGAEPRRHILDLREVPARDPVLVNAFDRDDALPDRRQHFVDREIMRDARGQPDAF